jgi:hypothetical protein
VIRRVCMFDLLRVLENIGLMEYLKSQKGEGMVGESIVMEAIEE